jgi:hypothetical protein
VLKIAAQISIHVALFGTYFIENNLRNRQYIYLPLAVSLDSRQKCRAYQIDLGSETAEHNHSFGKFTQISRIIQAANHAFLNVCDSFRDPAIDHNPLQIHKMEDVDNCFPDITTDLFK